MLIQIHFSNVVSLAENVTCWRLARLKRKMMISYLNLSNFSVVSTTNTGLLCTRSDCHYWLGLKVHSSQIGVVIALRLFIEEIGSFIIKIKIAQVTLSPKRSIHHDLLLTDFFFPFFFHLWPLTISSIFAVKKVRGSERVAHLTHNKIRCDTKKAPL